MRHRYVEVDGAQVFYREAGPSEGLPLLLLHGFPSASHQYRRLIDALGARHRVIAPDYPGFGHTVAPPGYVFTFDALAATIDGFVRALGLDRFALYLFDFGGPVGLRLAEADPARVAGIVIQNANAYDAGLSPMATEFLASSADDIRANLLTLEATRGQYEAGTAEPELVDPTSWTLDQHFLDLPGRSDAQVALALDYPTNVARYPAWQAWLREHRPPTLIAWGRNDPIFTQAGAEAYLADLPDAELHLFDTGHFALEEHVGEIAELVDGFLRRISRLSIAVIGGTGRLGGAVVAEAVQRGHRVDALSSADVDVTDPASIASACGGHDAVVVAVKGPDHTVSRGARAVVDAGIARVVWIGGGATLTTDTGSRYLDRPEFPEQYRATAEDQARALEAFRAQRNGTTEWSYLSPPPVHLLDGPRAGSYRAAAQDTPITDDEGHSEVSTGNLAAAVLDAIEQRRFVRQRFTVAD